MLIEELWNHFVLINPLQFKHLLASFDTFNLTKNKFYWKYHLSVGVLSFTAEKLLKLFQGYSEKTLNSE